MLTERQTERSARAGVAGRVLTSILCTARRLVVEEETAGAVHELRLAEDLAARGDGEPHATARRRSAIAGRADEGAVHRFAEGARRRAAADDQGHERRAGIGEGDELRGRRRKATRG